MYYMYIYIYQITQLTMHLLHLYLSRDTNSYTCRVIPIPIVITVPVYYSILYIVH